MNENYHYFEMSADYVRLRMPFEPEIAVVLGSSLGPFAEEIENPVEISYYDIPNFLMSTAPGHAGKLIFGTVAGKRVVCLSGRFHSYEGYAFEQLTQPVRLLKMIGVKAIILTNAAGGINTSFSCGDFMLITDHIKLIGNGPTRGKNLEEFGPRFYDVSTMYTPALQDLARKCAKMDGIDLKEGVYFFMTGPQYETPAEIRAIRILGGDAVGMSTITEALTAAHCGMPLLAISVITNMAAGVTGKPLSGDEVEEVGQSIAVQFSMFMKTIIREMTF